MSSALLEVIKNHRENAEIYTDQLLCVKKSFELLEEINMPRGLLPLEDIVEVGRNHETGFVWLKQKKVTDHCFKKIKKTVTYAAEVTAFVEDRRLKNITGVKTKELSFWVNISDICIKDPESKKIIFGIPSGIRRTFPASAFEEEEEKKEEEKTKDKK
ncbi:PREDICTED: uncharacterized protein LOC109244292 [Nicotiana attenuata]|uniref:DUF538 domain-containing protein n=1 Tax=Nicotiana attenuata TaxID=49451 RepID=A0A314L0F4_NICAT|nr:PREDICTED: uncharacterized protein LOC109244292 [Nicotiana attenuata]OIT34737.1 hypothetical protein A4A49_11716 [Nicotiana attenuata]